MHDAMVLWDGLFACDPTFELAQWVCVAMLIRIRNQCKTAPVSPSVFILTSSSNPVRL
jgi:TBC1 domain family member 5